MHMQDGIGRAGYRMLAGVFFALGLVGLATTLYAFAPAADLFDWLGFGFSAVAFVVMFTIILVVLSGPAPPRRAAPVKPAPTAPPEAADLDAAPAKPTVAAMEMPPRNVSFEYADSTPAAPAAPTKMVLPGAFRETGPEVAVPNAPARRAPTAPRDPRDWPERRGPNATRKELGERYTANAPVVRDIISAATGGAQASVMAPTVLARALPSAESPAPAGMAKGRCGGCGTVLAAPRTRPVNLRCPRCDKVTLLK